MSVETSAAIAAPIAEPKRLAFFERYLTVWVLGCMVVGVAFGKLLPDLTETLSRLEFGQGVWSKYSGGHSETKVVDCHGKRQCGFMAIDRSRFTGRNVESRYSKPVVLEQSLISNMEIMRPRDNRS